MFLKTRDQRIAFAVTAWLCLGVAHRSAAINITIDYSLDANNANWFGDTPAGIARRQAIDTAASFLSTIITNDDWSPLPNFHEFFSVVDVAASTVYDLAGNPVSGIDETDGAGFRYNIETTNRNYVAANEYVIYVTAFEFDSGTYALANASWDSNDRRNLAGALEIEFNTWGGRINFDPTFDWYTGFPPGINPTSYYGVQDPDKLPATDITSDNWDYFAPAQVWRGFDLKTLDPTVGNASDLYGTAIHEMLHVLGATGSNFENYVGLNENDELIGSHLTASFGGPVPTYGGHFAYNMQSTVWNSDGIVSEVVLDPTSTGGVRKYLTDLDVALLRDLGYEVLTSLNVADFNFDTMVDSHDLTLWQSSFGLNAEGDADGDRDTDGRDFLTWQRQLGAGVQGQSTTISIPEPSSYSILLILQAFFLGRRRLGGSA